MVRIPILLLLLFVGICNAAASPAEVYDQALSLAAQGKDGESVAMLAGAANTLSGQPEWHERMLAAEAMIEMRRQRAVMVNLPAGSAYATRVSRKLQADSAPAPASPWLAGVMAAVLPGAGHAWLGRWRDAGTAALLVWPMLFLTAWAYRRSMGPVTVFFALLTIWLWSGTIFSAVSLSERGSFEAYILWWRDLWLASGLAGQPWR